MFSRLLSSERLGFALLFAAVAVALVLWVLHARGLPPFPCRPTEPVSAQP